MTTDDLVPGPHGGDADRVAAALGLDVDEVLDLSASLNPVAPDCMRVLQRRLGALRRYPDDHAATEALAEVLGADPKRVVLTNGGSEAIALVAGLHPMGWADEFDFSLYRRHLRTVDESGPRWRSDPHSPTGRLRSPSERSLVRDEAFYLLATGAWTRGDPDSIVVGSLTKAFALPGLRVGYVVARDAREAEAIERLRPRWSVNGLVSASLPELLAAADPARWHAEITRLRAELVAVLRSNGLEPEHSDANYVWVPEAAGLRTALLPHGIIVRDGASFGYPRAVRVAVPDERGLERLAAALPAAVQDSRKEP